MEALSTEMDPGDGDGRADVASPVVNAQLKERTPAHGQELVLNLYPVSSNTRILCVPRGYCRGPGCSQLPSWDRSLGRSIQHPSSHQGMLDDSWDVLLCAVGNAQE